MLWDDRPQYPMTFVVQFHFSGAVNRQFMELAFDEAAERHPLVNAIIKPAKQDRDCWVKSRDAELRIDWGGIDDPIDLPDGEAIDVRSESGVRIWIRHNDERAVLTVQFHHCVCDGIGSYQFLGDVMWSYSRYCEGHQGWSEAGQGQWDVANLRDRGRALYNPEYYRTDNGKFGIEWGEVSRLALKPIAKLKPLRGAGPPEQYPFPGICSTTFSRSEYRRIRLAAQERGQTANDFLLEKLFVALREWNRRQGKHGGSYCVLLPMDVREAEANVIPATNILTYAFLRRSRRVLRREESLVTSLRQEMAMLKRDRHRSRFANVIAGAERFPTRLRNFLFGDRCLATAILSNTGDPTRRFHVDLPRENGAIRCGNLLLEDIAGVPPMRVKTRASVSIFTYRRVLKICLRCDPHLFSQEHTEQVLQLYVDTITRELPPPRAPK